MTALITQMGARRHYAVPLAIHRLQLLDTFVTDFYASGALGGAVRAARVCMPSRLARAALARTAAGLPEDRVKSFPLWTLRNKSLLLGGEIDMERYWVRVSREFCELSKRYLDEKHSFVYAFSTAARELFIEAEAKGVKRVLDHATAPRPHEMGLVREECERFPDWRIGVDVEESRAKFYARQVEEAQLADLIICNSTFARRTLEQQGKTDRPIAVVPPGLATEFVENLDRVVSEQRAERRDHSKLHVLYMGADGLRKGVPYLAKAIEMLPRDRFELRLAGDLQMTRKGLAAVGKVADVRGIVPRAEVPSHYAWADVVVLPSISDTFAYAFLEAMAARIPVIVSENTGGPDVINEGVDGYVVPIRDPEAIADRLSRLADDKSLRAEMGEQAWRKAMEFSGDAYPLRLLETLRGILPGIGRIPQDEPKAA